MFFLWRRESIFHIQFFGNTPNITVDPVTSDTDTPQCKLVQLDLDFDL
jgi:hypothetical protein